MNYFNIIAGNGTDIYHMRCYQRQKHAMIKAGLTYKFGNVIKKQDSHWVVVTSSIGIVPPVACHVQAPLLPEEEPATGMKRKIKDALDSPQKSTVCAKIVKVSSMAMKSEGTLPVRCLGLKDETSCTKVALFKDLAEQTYVEGSTVELSGLYKKVWNGKSQLVASRLTKCQFLSNDNVDVEVTEEDKTFFNHDEDFGGQKESSHTVTKSEVTSVMEAYVYDACSYDGCYKKKMTDNACPSCGGTEAVKTCRIKLEVEKEDGSALYPTIFEKDATALFGNLNFDLEEFEFLFGLSEKLPISFTAVVKSDALFNVKRV